jgi:hypothetical protein
MTSERAAALAAARRRGLSLDEPAMIIHEGARVRVLPEACNRNGLNDAE